MKNIILATLAIVFLGCGVTIAAPTASRTSGVAPLAVHFWADIAESTPSSHPYADYEYSWNFGDSNSGTWGNSGKSKNIDKGPVAAHVYEAAGTYTATLTVRNPNTGVTTSTASFEITVTNPDTVYSGTKTTCISTGTDFTGCPAGATQLPNQSTLPTLTSYADAGERVLFRRGDSWTVASEPNLPNNQGPVHIGAFGSCSSPDALGICSNAPTFAMASGVAFFNATYNRDWRITDLKITAAKSSPNAAFSGLIDVRNILLMRNTTTGFDTPFSVDQWRDNADTKNELLFIVENRATDCGVNGMYYIAERLGLMGNVVKNIDASHVVRVEYGYQAVIGHNDFSGSSLTSGTGRHALKFHGPKENLIGTYAQTGGGGKEYRSKFAVISNNIFGTSGPWPVSIGPQDSSSNENMHDILFEKNRSISDHGTISSTPVQVGLMFEGRYITIRNNIIDGTGSSSSYTGIFIARRGIENTPLGNRVYNNTIFNPDADSDGTGILIHADADDTTVRNNYVSFAGSTGSKTLLVDNSGNAVASNNVLTDSNNFIDPNNATPLSRNFAITSSATAAIDQGYTVPVRDDYLVNIRPFNDTYDVGAYEYGAIGESGESTIICYQDADNDLYGHGVSETVETCSNGYYIASHFTALTGDCNDNSAAIHPGATDTCGNSIDEDCSGADATCGATMAISTGSTMPIGAGTTPISVQ